jgi:hypothetical protein
LEQQAETLRLAVCSPLTVAAVALVAAVAGIYLVALVAAYCLLGQAPRMSQSLAGVSPTQG